MLSRRLAGLSRRDTRVDRPEAAVTPSTWMRSFLAVLLAALLVMPAAAQAPAALPSESFLHQLGELINGYRQRHGLAPLDLADDLAQLASEHSASMAARRQLSHEGFRSRLQSARSRVCVENVGWNFPTPEGLLEGWRQSPGHHRNLLDPGVSRMGLAVTTRYVTFFACR